MPYSSLSSFCYATKTNYFDANLVIVGGGPGGKGGLTFWLLVLRKSSLSKSTPFLPHLLSLTSIGSPN